MVLIAVCGYLDFLISLPASIPQEVDFDDEAHFLVCFMRNMQHLMLESGHQIRIGRLVRANLVFPPGAAPSLWLAELPQIVRLAKPQVRLRLSSKQIRIENRRHLIARQHKQASPGTKIRNHAQMRAYRPDTPYFAAVRRMRQLIEESVEVHEQALGLHLPDSRPFREPHMVHCLCPFRQPIFQPFSMSKHAQNGRGFVKAGGE